jgi:hypothetical protein
MGASLNPFTGQLQLNPSSTNPNTLTSVGAIDTATPSVNGAVDSSGALILQSASTTRPGLVNVVSQTFAGQKTFSTGLTGTLTGAASLNVLSSALGNLTDVGTDGITVTGGTSAVVGTVSIAQAKATASQNGYLASTDWTTFNSKQPTGNYATSATGDVSWPAPTGAGPVTTALVATTNATITTLSALVSVGTITTGIWHGTPIGAAFVSTLNQNTTGSAATLTTPRAINGVNFDGSVAITVTAAAGTLSGTTLNSTVVTSSLTSVGTITAGIWTGTTISVANGGTGITTVPTNGQIPIGNGSTYTAAAITSGSGISVINGVGTITIASTVAPSTGDLPETSFTAADNQVAAANVTGFAFANATVRSFDSIVSIIRGTTYQQFKLNGIQKAASWEMSQETVGDNCGIVFSITATGQIQYTSTSTGSTGVVRFRAATTTV